MRILLTTLAVYAALAAVICGGYALHLQGPTCHHGTAQQHTCP